MRTNQTIGIHYIMQIYTHNIQVWATFIASLLRDPLMYSYNLKEIYKRVVVL